MQQQETGPLTHLPNPDQTLIVRPGDALILRFRDPPTLEYANHIKTAVHQLLPDIDDVIVIACEQIAVYRPDDEQAHPV